MRWVLVGYVGLIKAELMFRKYGLWNNSSGEEAIVLELSLLLNDYEGWFYPLYMAWRMLAVNKFVDDKK